MGVETGTAILIATAVTAGTTAYFGKEQLDSASDARKKQDALEAQRKKELADQASAREASAAKAATSGQRAGLRSGLIGALGFGSGNTSQGLGNGSLFGN